MQDNATAKYSLIHCKIEKDDNINISRLPLSIRRFANRYNGLRRSQYLMGRALLAELLFRQTSILQLPDIVLVEKGRPIFADSTLPDFNISHSGNHIIVALAASSYRIGLDIELYRPRSRLLAVAKHSLSDNEYQWLTSLSNDKQAAGFWHLWTLRESILKLAGEGIWQMKEITLFPEKKKMRTSFIDTPFSLTGKLGDMFWAISSNNPLYINDLQWFSTDSNITQLTPVALPEITIYTHD